MQIKTKLIDQKDYYESESKEKQSATSIFFIP